MSLTHLHLLLDHVPVVGSVGLVVPESLVEHLPGFDERLVERHEDAALVATVAFAVLGLLAAAMLGRYRRAALPNAIAPLGLAGTLLTAALVAWTAGLGGQIRHTEIRGGAAAVPAAASGTAARDADHAARPER